MNKSALIVDDNDTMRYYLALVLQKNGFSIATATNGLEALQTLLKSDYELVLMDIDMPLLNGMDCTRCIRLIEDAIHCHPTIIGMTAGDYGRQDCLELGMDELLVKPFSAELLLNLFERFVGAAGGPADMPACS